MTVANGINENIFIGNGSSEEYIFTFPALDHSWVYATVNNVLQAATVVLNPDQGDNAGGSILFNTAPANGALVRIYRDVPEDQLLDLPDYTPFPSRNVEDALDKLTMAAAQKVDSEKGGDINGNLIIKRSGALIFASESGAITPDENDVYLFDTTDGNLKLSVSDGASSFIPVVLFSENGTDFLLPLESQAFPDSPSSVTNKNYVDQGLADKVSRFGDRMLGALNVPDQPATGSAAVNKTYVEEVITSIFDGLQFKGFYDASSGTLPPDTTNGDFYVIAVGGTLDVSDGLNPPTPEPVGQGDKIVYSENVSAWVGIRAGSGGSAGQVGFTPTGNYTATNLQGALDEADSSLFAHAGDNVDETLTGVKTFEDNAAFNGLIEWLASDGIDGNENYRAYIDDYKFYLQSKNINGWNTLMEVGGGRTTFYSAGGNVIGIIDNATGPEEKTLLTRKFGDNRYRVWYATEAEAQADNSGNIVYADAGS